MNIFSMRKSAAALICAGLLSACASDGVGTDIQPVTRNAPAIEGVDDVTTQAIAPAYKVVEVRVEVPRSLEVSEANRYYPGGDIVWREDPYGDRHAQVEAIVQAGLDKGATALTDGRPVIVHAKVKRFHALTQKARYTFGGVHAIQFELTLYDPNTGEALGPTRTIKADFKALGGQAAVEAEQQGQTQKVRITDHLSKVIRDELSTATGYREEQTGLIGAINQI